MRIDSAMTLILINDVIPLPEASRQSLKWLDCRSRSRGIISIDIKIIARPYQISERGTMLRDNNIGGAKQSHLKDKRFFFQQARIYMQFLR